MIAKSLSLALWLAAGSVAPSPVAAQSAKAWFKQQDYVLPSANRIVACHGYGCTRRLAVLVDGAWLEQAGAALEAGRGSPAAERRALREVVGRYTAYLSRSIGGRPDAPRSPPQLAGLRGQMDCLDETANTTSLLLVLEENGLLVHHRVHDPESRGFFLDGRYPHFTATVAEKKSGMRWAVDPWSKAPGQRPDILPLAQWRQDS